MGYRCEWEDVFCMAFDQSLRHLCDKCNSQEQWQLLFPDFAHAVCTKWDLAYCIEKKTRCNHDSHAGTANETPLALQAGAPRLAQ